MVLLDALGTLLELQPPGGALVRALGQRHDVTVSLADATRALAAEIDFYRRNNHRAGDRAGLIELRLACAEVLREQLPASARWIPGAELAATLVSALRFAAYPDVDSALEEIGRQGVARVIVSNWDVSLHEVLAQTGLAPLLEQTVTSAEVGAAKPDPAIFAAALARVGVQPAAAVHVGDSVAEDVEGARAAGVTPVLLARQANGSDPADVVSVDLGVTVIHSLEELPGLLGARRAVGPAGP